MKGIVLALLKALVEIFLAGLAKKCGCGECKQCAD